MSIFGKIRGFFKAKPKKTPVEAVKPRKTPELGEAKPKPAPVVVRKYGAERMSQVIRGMRMTEKSVHVTDWNQWIFEVLRDATRDEVKHAVEKMFDVKVDAVRMINVRGKAKRRGRRNDWSKAYVRLAPGHSIETTEIGA